ncbi:Uncharacterized protein OBRU01_09874 [Operophtera brumata]|uniref:Uncharacterized protein n=1 Tax=Operophtera brumata TaxID=104452 RepID=A0A0L7LED8_OPEBR|nr:Uncharacterized protein OBRU01_09874 [Operophtera brumata]
MVCCAVFVTSLADPEPKKYKSTIKKTKPSNTTLTAEERDFLREVESKFGIKQEQKDKTDDTDVKPTISGAKPTISGVKPTSPIDLKLPFPAVIAIEIVNDTDTKSQVKGKRTIDANLGYGYKTNSGYSYTYFGKPAHDQGKFMIYPYSQEDIPSTNGHTGITDVEITPSRAFELVSVKDEKEAYHYPKPTTEFKTNYDDVKGLVSPPPSYSSNANAHGIQGSSHSFLPSTLYTTYNGHELSGLSGQFPTVMPNYFVDPSQLLRNPEYQNVGLTNDHLRPHGPKIADQRVVPVLVLRIPSSSLKNPTAELFANLPSNYPLSRYLNNVNLQGLVNQYFKKQGYPFAPQVMHYQDSLQPIPADTPINGNYGRQHYATPHVQPSYTQSDHSGVQYSAVQPVMARYPSSYTQRFNLPHGHSLYHQPLQQQKYEYRYQYVPQHVQSSHPTAVPQTYYIQPQYQQQTHEAETVPETNPHDTSAENQVSQDDHVQSHVESAENYQYQQQSNEESDGNNLILSENYPSKDHTIATVLPVSYTAKQPNIGAVQTVSYVTPMPYSSKYQSPYRIMVPQTFLTNPSTEKVAYVNSHSVSAYTHPQQEQNSEAEYTVGPHHIPPVSKQKPPSYPRNYHSHPKRMAKPEIKPESSPVFPRKQSDRNEKKKL